MTVSLRALGVRGVILDIEGTTTPATFVYDVLFPYAKARMADYLRERFDTPDVREAARLMGIEWAGEKPPREVPPPWLAPVPVAGGPPSLARYAESLMGIDRKSQGLKILQGLIWEQGYRDGALQGELYPDVAPALARWRAADVDIAIYSSGSVLAQRLLFGHSVSGDLTPMIGHHFDTGVGPKKLPASYQHIADEMQHACSELLFVSDTVAELSAARDVGVHTLLCVRDVRADDQLTDPGLIHSFDEINP